MKAKFIEKFYNPDGTVMLVYEYRGTKYDVTDYGWRGGEPLSWQHRNAQAHIDEVISAKEQSTPESYESGLELFWESVGM